MLRKFTVGIVVTVLLAGAACASDNGSTEDAQTGDSSLVSDKAKVTTTREGDMLVKRFDIDGNDKPDVIKYYKTIEESDDEGVTKRRMQRKKVDVNSDGKMDIIRFYDDQGEIKRERLDVNLDGTYDSISHFDSGQLVRKEMLGEDGKTVTENRIYSDGNIKRVEKDRNGDGKVDYWEYYEDGVLQRIGRDVNGDEKIDKWVHRKTRKDG